MKQVEYFFWFLPNANPRGKPYLSRWKMSEEEAKARGATRPDPGSREVREVPETPEEEAELRRLTDTSVLSGKPRP